MNSKCPSCGLVNFAGIDTCRRCGTGLSGGQAPSWPSNASYGGNYGGGHGGAYGSSPGPSAPPPPYGDTGTPSYGGWQPGATFNPGPSYGMPNPHYGTPYASFGGYGMAVPELAGRGTRLGAAILDGLYIYAPLIVAVVFAAVVGKDIGMLFVGLGALLTLAVVVVQIVNTSLHGQSLGKKTLGIRVVRLDTGENGGFVTNVIMRNVVPALIGFIPYVGPIFGLVDVCFIFRDDQRCIHDLIAGTVVVVAR